MTAPAEPETAATATDTITIDGRSVVVHGSGSGTPVCYLHGMIGTPSAAPILSAGAKAGLTMTAPCLPGFSGSDPHPAKRSIHDWVFHLSAIIDAAGVAGQPVVATSVGAMVAIELAAIRPEAFSSLVLVSPLGLWEDDDPIADPFAATLSMQRRMLTADPTVTGPFFDDPQDLVGDDLIEHGVARYETRTAAAALVWPIPDHGFAERAHRVSAPITLVWGAEDRIVPGGYDRRWSGVLPNVIGSHTVADAGHLVDWDRPEAVASLVADHVTGPDAGHVTDPDAGHVTDPDAGHVTGPDAGHNHGPS